MCACVTRELKATTTTHIKKAHKCFGIKLHLEHGATLWKIFTVQITCCCEYIMKGNGIFTFLYFNNWIQHLSTLTASESSYICFYCQVFEDLQVGKNLWKTHEDAWMFKSLSVMEGNAALGPEAESSSNGERCRANWNEETQSNVTKVDRILDTPRLCRPAPVTLVHLRGDAAHCHIGPQVMTL